MTPQLDRSQKSCQKHFRTSLRTVGKTGQRPEPFLIYRCWFLLFNLDDFVLNTDNITTECVCSLQLLVDCLTVQHTQSCTFPNPKLALSFPKKVLQSRKVSDESLLLFSSNTYSFKYNTYGQFFLPQHGSNLPGLNLILGNFPDIGTKRLARLIFTKLTYALLNKI